MFSFIKFLKPKGREGEGFVEEDDTEPALVEAVPEPVKKETLTEEADALPKEEIPEEKTLFEKVLPLNAKKGTSDTTPFRFNSTLHTEYIPPPLSLLASDKGKPGYGDIKAYSEHHQTYLPKFRYLGRDG